MLPKTLAKFLAVVSPTSSMPREKINLYNSIDAEWSIDLSKLSTDFFASSIVSQISTPLPAARPSYLITIGIFFLFLTLIEKPHHVHSESHLLK